MKVIYIAGPFRGPNSWAIENNIRRAEALSLQVWESGAAAICPHTNMRFFQGVGPDDRWLEGDLAILRRCDAVLMTPDWQLSKGAVGEMDEGHRCEIPVFYNLQDLKRWLMEENAQQGT